MKTNMKNMRKVEKMAQHITMAASAALLFLLLRASVYAATMEDAVEVLRRQFVDEGAREATATIPGDVSVRDVYYALVCADREDSLYDGETLMINGSFRCHREGNRYVLTRMGGYEIAGADALTDRMADEVRTMAGEDAGQRALWYSLCEYISGTYSYNEDERVRILNGEEGERSNFVDAYDGDRKIVCTSYAAVTYLVANKLGIECEIVRGERHVYNVVRFVGEETFIGYDLAGSSKYAAIPLMSMTEAKYRMDGIKDDLQRENAEKMNKGKEYRCAYLTESIRAFLYYTALRPQAKDLCIVAEVVMLLTGYAFAIMMCCAYLYRRCMARRRARRNHGRAHRRTARLV